MDTVAKESTTILSPPPPPPPPLMPMHNGNVGNGMDNGRSQLLADIRKGMVLNKTPIVTKDSNHNELSPSDKLKKQTQDLLHAELSSTLRRRKPVVINEPPKYEYPTYDDSNGNNNSSSNGNNKINDSSHSTSVNIATPKPLNVNAVLSVVTGIKLPDIQYDANTKTAAATKSSPNASAATNDKRKISHGKPNFTINNHQKENKSIATVHKSPSSPSSPPLPKTPSLKMQINGPSIDKTVVKNGPTIETTTTTITTSVQPKLHRPSFFTNNSIGIDKTVVKTTPMAKPAIETNGSESQVEKCKSIFMIKSQKSHDETAKSIAKCPLKLDSTTKMSLVGVNEQPPKPKEILIKKISIDESSATLSNGIPFTSVANKKALFERPAFQGENHQQKLNGTLRGAQTEKLNFNKPPSSPSSLPPLSVSSPPSTPSASMSNGKFNTLNGHRTNGHVNGHQKPSITTITLNKNAPYAAGNGTLDRQRPKYQRTPSAKDSVDYIERSVHETSNTRTTTTTMQKTTTTNKYETKQQFEQKTIVSFSKDLLNAPNNYPEQIRVKKTIINEPSGIAAANNADTPFHNIRFSIKQNGQVIPKAK